MRGEAGGSGEEPRFSCDAEVELELLPRAHEVRRGLGLPEEVGAVAAAILPLAQSATPPGPLIGGVLCLERSTVSLACASTDLFE